MTDIEVPEDVVAQLREICLAFPEVNEETAWVGTRWRVGGKTFAHVLSIADGWPPAYARASATDGPALVLMFRSWGPELNALREGGDPFFGPPWRADEVGMFLDDHIDWAEVSQLLTDSYCVQAPRRLAALVERPAPPSG